MAVNTETIPVESGTAAAEATHPPPRGRRPAVVWAAIVAACIVVAALAVATFTGGDDVPAQGFYPEAEAYEREAHLEGNARTYSRADARDANYDEFLPDSGHIPTR